MSTGLFQDEEESYNIEETKYVLKGSAPSTDSSFDAGPESFDEPEEEIDGMDAFDDAAPEEGNSDKPFDDEPFDAGVEADEDTDPAKYIQQLSGKLGQSLRQYTEDEGQPDFDLEKFAVNSVLSATHTGEMDKGDQRDIIKKVKGSGNNEETGNDEATGEEDMGFGEEEPTGDGGEEMGFGEEEPVEEIVEELPLNKTDENKKESSILGAGYTHFAIFKANNMIADGWDYKSLYDKYEKTYDNHSILEYSREDIRNNFPNNKVSDFKIVTRKFLEKKGLDPTDSNNWYKISGDSLQESKKYGTFVDKTKLIKDLRLMENLEPMTLPITKPEVKPVRPMRETDRPFLPKRKDKVNPKPKATVTEDDSSIVEFNGKQINVNSLKIEGVDRRDYPDFVDSFFTYGEYSDGMEMSDIELQKFTDENGELLNKLIFDRQLYMQSYM